MMVKTLFQNIWLSLSWLVSLDSKPRVCNWFPNFLNDIMTANCGQRLECSQRKSRREKFLYCFSLIVPKRTVKISRL